MVGRMDSFSSYFKDFIIMLNTWWIIILVSLHGMRVGRRFYEGLNSHYTTHWKRNKERSFSLVYCFKPNKITRIRDKIMYLKKKWADKNWCIKERLKSSTQPALVSWVGANRTWVRQASKILHFKPSTSIKSAFSLIISRLKNVFFGHDANLLGH